MQHASPPCHTDAGPAKLTGSHPTDALLRLQAGTPHQHSYPGCQVSQHQLPQGPRDSSTSLQTHTGSSHRCIQPTQQQLQQVHRFSSPSLHSVTGASQPHGAQPQAWFQPGPVLQQPPSEAAWAPQTLRALPPKFAALLAQRRALSVGAGHAAPGPRLSQDCPAFGSGAAAATGPQSTAQHRNSGLGQAPSLPLSAQQQLQGPPQVESSFTATADQIAPLPAILPQPQPSGPPSLHLQTAPGATAAPGPAQACVKLHGGPRAPPPPPPPPPIKAKPLSTDSAASTAQHCTSSTEHCQAHSLAPHEMPSGFPSATAPQGRAAGPRAAVSSRPAAPPPPPPPPPKGFTLANAPPSQV